MGVAPTVLRGVGDRFLACFGTQVGPPQRCTVISTTQRKVIGGFEVAEWPAKVFVATDDWLVAGSPGDGPAPFREVDDEGRVKRRLSLPTSWMAEMAGAGRESLLWLPRIFSVAGQLWASPIGHYGFWNLDDLASVEVKVPAAMFVTSHTEPLREPRLRPRTGQRSQRVVGDVRDVASAGRLAVVLIAGDPDAPEPQCRIDVWEFPASHLLRSVPLPRPCARNVLLGRGGVWTRAGTRLVWVPLALGSAPGGRSR
ncbi:MAG TPA: hypothetical protein PK435_14190 [Thermoanaerobaculaceae bacterium]|nr:hypothetical protein [Thermoanaerobaculaceae bacterium]